MDSGSGTRTSMSKRDKRDAAVAELLNTEATYVSDMKMLVDVFIVPLEGWAADMEAMRESDFNEGESRQPHLTHEDCRQIFANAKQLATFNRQFLSDLRKAHGGDGMNWRGCKRISRRGSFGEELDYGNNSGGHEAAFVRPSALTLPGMDVGSNAIEDDPFALTVRKEDVSEGGGRDVRSGAMVGVDPDRGPRQMLEVFLKSAPFLKMYSVYVNNFDRARERLSKLERENPAVAAFLTACERQRHCRGLRLRDFLIQPVQRIPRYRLLLETILLYTPIESSIRSSVEESLNAMGKIASKINADVSLQQQKNKVFELQQEFGGADFLSASRLFIREGDLAKVGRNGPERLHFVLFNDLLVYGQAKRMRTVLGGMGSGLAQGKQLYYPRREVNLHKCFVVDAPSYGTKYSSFLGDTGLLIVSEEKSFVVMASTPVEKDSWLQAMRACMRDLALNTEARERMCGRGDYDGDRPRSPVSSLGRSSRWSGSAHGPLGPLVSASAPRAVWVPGKDGGKGVRLVDFSLPTWAGVRKSCGCLSFTELTWGKDGMGSRGSGVSGLAMSMGMNSGLAAAFGSGMQLPTARVPRSLAISGQENKAPAEISVLASMSPSERLGLRLRDVHPGCGGGVVVVGFEPKSCAKRAGVRQGDRITRVDGVATFKAVDIAWALSQQYPGGLENGRTVLLTLTRGFPKTDKPWLPPLEMAPMDRTTSPASSGVDSCATDSPPAVLSAPGSRTFSGDGGAGAHRRGFAAVAADDGDVKADVRTIAAGTAEQAAGRRVGGMASASVRSLHFSGKDLEDSGSDLFFSGSMDDDREQADSSAGIARKRSGDAGGGGDGSGSGNGGSVGAGPAPAQANADAGGAPAKPLSTALPGALTACWTCQTDDPFQASDEDARNKRESKGKYVDKPGKAGKQKKLKGAGGLAGMAGLRMGACVGTGSLDEKDESDESGNDSDGTGSSSSSLFLTAVSPSRVPPPLISMASTLPPPPVSMASSVEDSLSNFSPGRAWYSPTLSQAETPDNSMSWLKPLPPPPPRRDQAGTAPTHSPPPPIRAGHGRVYSGRWAQTPPLGEPKTSPSSEVKLEDARGF